MSPSPNNEKKQENELKVMENEIFPSQINTVLDSCGFHIADHVTIDGRQGRFGNIPAGLHPQVSSWLDRQYSGKLYAHQIKALDEFLEGNDVCLATGTASGKSLVFITAAIHLLLSDPAAKVLAFYPARALIRDQMGKWQEACKYFGFLPTFIDGSIATRDREDLLATHRVILMTPDVAHAWLLDHLTSSVIQQFLSRLRLIILDEAHVYDGVFGTNMAFFLRRLFAVADVKQVITSTATIGYPEEFITALLGRYPSLVDSSDDCTPTPSKEIFLVSLNRGAFLDSTALLVKGLAQSNIGRFLVFADSRKMVEQIVSIAARKDADDTEVEEASEDLDGAILPYRAGYEEEDRATIQDSLANGRLAGVVSTSALELGLDIGDIDIVVILRTPKNINSFRQRMGRVGRKHKGYVLIINDSDCAVENRSINQLLSKHAEKSWLYLDNVYIQYIHALCAFQEISDFGTENYNMKSLVSLPKSFMAMLQNELNPTESIPPELYSLRQRGQNDPHIEFGLRSDSGKTFAIVQNSGFNQNLGSVTYSQALREAYPGAIYYYMAKPYRVTEFSFRRAEITVMRAARYTTQPILQNMVFPRPSGNIKNCMKSFGGFLMESDVQVDERVIGFHERQGKKTTEYKYGPLSQYYQRPIVRFFESTGILWFIPDFSLLTERFARIILETYCGLNGIQERDLDCGTFDMRSSSIWPGGCKGLCIYDTVSGSLRLSHGLYDQFANILDLAGALIEEQEDKAELLKARDEYLEWLTTLRPISSIVDASPWIENDDDWQTLVAPHQKAIFKNLYGDEEVEIAEYRYTPRGLMYRLESQDPTDIRLVPNASIFPLPDRTKMIRVNLVTGETYDEPLTRPE
ncbi:MAG TPA: DEAD/DEAH box helicase [Spirochaetales bacterium]|nr:DEAD/DEAH box helicase [Spirochaetales bacterium]